MGIISLSHGQVLAEQKTLSKGVHHEGSISNSSNIKVSISKVSISKASLIKIALLTLLISLLTACSSTSPPSARKAGALQLDPAYREALVAHAMMHLGTPYRYGGNHPGEGFDCSGFVRYSVAQSTQANLPRTTKDIAGATSRIRTSSLKRGDFVFFNTSGPYTHMGIYLGDGQFVHAPSSRNRGAVRVDSMDSKYFSKRFMEARTAFR